MQDIALIIFDCDGVLVDSELIANRIFQAELNNAGVPITLDHLLETYMGHSLKHCLELICQQYGIALGSDFLATYQEKRDAALMQVKAVDGVDTLIRHLSLPFCVASNSASSKIHNMLTYAGLIDYFEDNIFSASDVAKPKPAPDVYLKAAASFGVSPAHCLVIEDTPIGVQAAVAAGMQVFGYAAFTPAHVLLKAGASKVFFSMTGLQTAIHHLLIKETS
jgi:HAD superfamily hydrolase (TIGR01509 family)